MGKSFLVIAHSALPFLCVEDAEIKGSVVEVSYFDETFDGSEIENAAIPVKELVDFVDTFYGPGVIDMFNGEHFQIEDSRTTLEYIEENLKPVVTDYLNAGNALNKEGEQS